MVLFCWPCQFVAFFPPIKRECEWIKLLASLMVAVVSGGNVVLSVIVLEHLWFSFILFVKHFLIFFLQNIFNNFLNVFWFANVINLTNSTTVSQDRFIKEEVLYFLEFFILFLFLTLILTLKEQAGYTKTVRYTEKTRNQFVPCYNQLSPETSQLQITIYTGRKKRDSQLSSVQIVIQLSETYTAILLLLAWTTATAPPSYNNPILSLSL